MLLGLVAGVVGLWVAAEYDTAPGATIVLVAIGSFAAVAAASTLRRAAQRRSTGRAATPADVEPPDVVLSP
jgi:zinc transport system permease protein